MRSVIYIYLPSVPSQTLINKQTNKQTAGPWASRAAPAGQIGTSTWCVHPHIRPLLLNSMPASVFHTHAKRTGRFWAPRAYTHTDNNPHKQTPHHHIKTQVDNQRSHGPGGQGPEADPCFATVVRGRETIEEYHKVGP